MGAGEVPERAMSQVVARLRTITGIQRLLLEQIDVAVDAPTGFRDG